MKISPSINKKSRNYAEEERETFYRWMQSIIIVDNKTRNNNLYMNRVLTLIDDNWISHFPDWGSDETLCPTPSMALHSRPPRSEPISLLKGLTDEAAKFIFQKANSNARVQKAIKARRKKNFFLFFSLASLRWVESNNKQTRFFVSRSQKSFSLICRLLNYRVSRTSSN